MSADLFIENSYKISELITREYSTSFSLATSLLEKEKRRAVYAIYGFVRLADEIVDSFHGFDKSFLLDRLEKDLEYALQHGISTNTVLAAFSDSVKSYGIAGEHIRAFMDSMRCDLDKSNFTQPEELERYIYGSADVVGLMCLKVFCNGNQELFTRLELPARRLGSAFQKVNFLRDLKEDLQGLGRCYFPEITNSRFDLKTKGLIENSIERDFEEARKGIRYLPGRSRFAVALAYHYYLTLFNKIRNASPMAILSERVRISNFRKYLIIIRVAVMYKTRSI